MAPLFYCNLQSCLREALKDSQDYRSTAHLTLEVKEELHWLIEHITNWNGQSLIFHNEPITIETDASTLGWGATCSGIRTGGPWSRQKKSLHINCLELSAAMLAVKCFAKGTTSLSTLLKMDNEAAPTYINRSGGTTSPQLTKLSKEQWLCMVHGEEHLPLSPKPPKCAELHSGRGV